VRIRTVNVKLVTRYACAAICGLAIASSSVFADEIEPHSVAAHIADGALASYTAGNFAQAIADYKTAFELDPKSDYLFGWAQSTRRSGDCPGALVLYRKLLAMKLADDQLAATRQAMSRCPSEPVPVVAPKSDPWYRDWTAHAFTGGGAIALGVGVWATIVSVRDERAARDAETYGEHARLTDRAVVFRIVGISGIAVGAISAAIGVVRYTRHGNRSETATVTGWIDHDRGGIAAGFAW
jgi:hypothetical protein